MTRMRTVWLLMKLLLKDELKLSHIKSVSIKLKLSRLHEPDKNVLLNRFHLVKSILIHPFFWLIRLKKINGNCILAFECTKKDEALITDYIYYFRKNKKSCTSRLPVHVIDRKKLNVTIDNKTSVRQILNCFNIWLFFLIAGIYSLFDKKQISLSWLIIVLNYMINVELLKSSINETYFFKGRYRITSHLPALLISYLHKNIEINVSLGNTPLFAYSRYNYIRNANLIVQNPLIYEEALQFMKKKWFNAKRIYLENEYGYKNINKSASRYDIGIYSSGFWARDSSFRRKQPSDIDYLKNKQDLTNNLPYNYFVEILTGIIDLKKQYPHLKIKIYTHPHERILSSSPYNLFPPYYNMAKKNDIIVDLEGESSMDKIYEPKIGISIMSTIAFERFNLGLISYILTNDYTKKFYDPIYYGKYSKYFFHNIEELTNKLKKELSI